MIVIAILLFVIVLLSGCAAEKNNTEATSESETDDASELTNKEKFLEQFNNYSREINDGKVCYIRTNSATGTGICIVGGADGTSQAYYTAYVTLNDWADWEKTNDGYIWTLNGQNEFVLLGNKLFIFSSNEMYQASDILVYIIDETTGTLEQSKESIDIPSLKEIFDKSRGMYKGVYPEIIYNDSEKVTVVWKVINSYYLPDEYRVDSSENGYNKSDMIVSIAEYDSNGSETVLYTDSSKETFKIINENWEP